MPDAAHLDYLIDFGIDLVAIFLLAYVLYYRRHRRSDLLLAYVALNVGLFVAMSLLTTVRLDVALGFGLFAILSIIRLRSNTITQEEVAYYFIVLVIGLANGLRIGDRWMIVILNAILILTMFVVDSRTLHSRARRRIVTLDVVHDDEVALVADLERRLGGPVVRHQVDEVDYVRNMTVVDVRYQARGQASWVGVRRQEVTLDVVHDDDATLIADLERRLGGRVVHHVVGKVDYVRDVMVVDVTYQARGGAGARVDLGQPS